MVGKIEGEQAITTKTNTGNILGIAAFVFGSMSIFFLAPLFVPLAFMLGSIALINRQLVWGTLGLLCAVIGFLTSPFLLEIFGLASVGPLMP